jgi:secretion/DNA translocation related TadE-like protein
VVARHRAAGAADLAALAGAQLLVRGDPQPCAAAARVAEESGARLDSCQVEAGTVLVVTAVELGWSAWGLDMPPARARARAGPQ